MVELKDSKGNGTKSKALSDDLSNDCVKIVTKKVNAAKSSDLFENPESYGGSVNLLSLADFGEIGGLKSFIQTNAKILEIVSHNNLLMAETVKEVREDCSKQLKEKDDQIRYSGLFFDLRQDPANSHLDSDFCMILLTLFILLTVCQVFSDVYDMGYLGMLVFGRSC